MHFHAEHALFFGQRRPPRRTLASLGLASSALLLNVGADSLAVSVVTASVGGLLLVAAGLRGHNRLTPAVTWLVSLVVLALASNLLLTVPPDQVWQAAARVLCGMVWVL